MGTLTAARVKALTKPGRYGDGGTLYLHIAPGGSKSWVQRVAVRGRRRDIGLGGWPVVGLAKARQRAFANRGAVSDGRDSLADTRKARTPTFREAALKSYEANRPRWRSENTAAIWLAQMELHAFPALADRPVDRIGREEVLRVLTPLWSSKPDIARKLRGRIRGTLASAQAHGLIEHNVAGEAIDGALAPMPAVMKHHRALPYREVRAALDAVRASGASLAAKAGFEYLVLTAARAGEVRLATWAEIDLEDRRWRVPAARMKTGVEHRVPLSDAAVAVLERARRLRGAGDWLFPSPLRGSKPLSNMAWSKLLKELGVDAVPHGFRSSFRDFSSERTGAGTPSRERGRAELRAKRLVRETPRADGPVWARYVTGGSSAQVVRLHGRAT